MNKTTTLEIIENLKKEGLDLKNLTDSQIIRIEKKLKARIKLDQALDINDLESIINLLRSQASNLEVFFQEDLKPIRLIVENKDYVIISRDAVETLKVKGPQLKSFLSEFFSDELLAYARKCFENDHYRALYHFLSLRDSLDEKILDTVRNQMEQRFLLLSETFRLHANRKPDKIKPLLNPYFYRCINSLNRDAIFEDRIMDFQNLIIEKENQITSRHFVLLIFSLTHYSAIREHHKEVIKQNRSFSISEGANETKTKGKNQFFKGETYHHEKVKFGIQSIRIFLIPAIIVLVIIFRINNSRPDYSSEIVNQRFLNQIHNIDIKSEGRKTWENATKDELYRSYLPDSETIDFLQFKTPEIVETIPLDSHNDYVFKNSPLELSKISDYLQLMNITSNPIILILQNEFSDSTFLLLQPLDSIDVSFDLSKLTVYKGQGLSEIIYSDKNDSIQHGLRFTKFDASDEIALNKVYTFENINNSRYHTIQIFEDNISEAGISLKHKVSKTHPIFN